MPGKGKPWILMGVKAGLMFGALWIPFMGLWTGEWKQALVIGPFVALSFGIFFPLAMRLCGFRSAGTRDSDGNTPNADC